MKTCISFLTLIILIFSSFQKAEGFAPNSLFKKYPNPIFIETGSYIGDGIRQALKAGFKNVYSIELSPELYEYCRNLFRTNREVKLYQGDSGSVLPVLLQEISRPATFWLDGHYSEGNTAKGMTNTPILAELDAIRNHPIKTHTILIDDIRCFGNNEFDHIELDEVIKKILEINPNYHIVFEDGYAPNDILVAYVK